MMKKYSLDDLWDIIGYVKAVALKKMKAYKGENYGN